MPLTGQNFMGEIMMTSFDFAPKGWALCNGQLLQINQNQALFSLLGTMYGGDGRVTFALPDLRARVPLGWGSTNQLGTSTGEEFHTVNVQEMPQHIHTLVADATTAATSNVAAPTNNLLGQSTGQQTPGGPFPVQMYSPAAPTASLSSASITSTGGSQPHENRQPYLTISFCIALQGIFPSRP